MIRGFSVNVIEMLVHFSPTVIAALNGVRNPIHNVFHRVQKARFSDILKARFATANLNRRVLVDEPRLENYFIRIIPLTSRCITRCISV